jgi:hypothetical protein
MVEPAVQQSVACFLQGTLCADCMDSSLLHSMQAQPTLLC